MFHIKGKVLHQGEREKWIKDKTEQSDKGHRFLIVKELLRLKYKLINYLCMYNQPEDNFKHFLKSIILLLKLLVYVLNTSCQSLSPTGRLEYSSHLTYNFGAKFSRNHISIGVGYNTSPSPPPHLYLSIFP